MMRRRGDLLVEVDQRRDALLRQRGHATSELWPSPRESPSATYDAKSQFNASRGAHGILQTGQARIQDHPAPVERVFGNADFTDVPHTPDYSQSITMPETAPSHIRVAGKILCFPLTI